jgi:pimeloyl-ACP methyl ester carboxylesterase
VNDRPRVLLVPTLTELEWVIKPALDEWAEVATYDTPGVGDEPPVDDLSVEAIARRGIEEADRRGWDRFVVVGDEWGVVTASHLASQAGERVIGLALGHARLSNSPDEPRPAINREVLDAIRNLIRTDNRMYVQQMFKGTRGESMGGYRDQLVDQYVRRVPLPITRYFDRLREGEGRGLGARLAALGVPMLLAQHKDCLMFTNEGFEDAARELPHVAAGSYIDKPSTSLEFSEDLRQFCANLATVSA